MKRSPIAYLLAVAAVVLIADFAVAQRRVTPVNSSDELKTVSKEELKEIKRRTEAKLMRPDSLTLDSLRRDSAERAARKVYRPTLMSATAGINVWNLLMRAFGQTYGGGDIWFALNLKNRFIPVVELGVGQANSTPADGNFTYKSKAAFYGKVGLNYNFMAAKDSRYQLYAGIRLAGSSFRYDITDITADNGYWGDESSSFDIRNQKSSAFWGEAVVGIQVELFKNVSLGWAFRYNFPFSIKDTPNSRPWYIPGYGTRGNPINFSLSVAYTLPFHKDRKTMEVPIPRIPQGQQPDGSADIPDRERRVREPQQGMLPQNADF